jgi:hypothetical protein
MPPSPCCRSWGRGNSTKPKGRLRARVTAQRKEDDD